ncbi:MAG: hypothetical protein KDB53_21055 [Planctomycetes bacterium]|nr:hypothetical protein [Planctomycetota bacterium]
MTDNTSASADRSLLWKGAALVMAVLLGLALFSWFGDRSRAREHHREMIANRQELGRIIEDRDALLQLVKSEQTETLVRLEIETEARRQAEASIAEGERDRASLLAELEETRARVAAREATVAGLEARAKATRLEFEALEARHRERGQKLGDLAIRASTLSAENRRLAGTYDNAQDRMSRLQEGHLQLVSRHDHLAKSKSELEESLSETARRLREMMTQQNETSDRLQVTERALRESVSQIATQERQIAAAALESTRGQELLEDLRRRLTRSERTAETSHQKLTALQAEFQGQSQRVRTQMSQLDRAAEAARAQAGELETTLADLGEARRALTESRAKLEDERVRVAAANQKLEDAIASNRQLTAHQNELQSAVDRGRRELRALVGKNEEATKRGDALTKRMATLEAELATLRARLKAQMDAKKSQDEAKVEWESRSLRLANAVLEERREREGMQARVAALRAELGEAVRRRIVAETAQRHSEAHEQELIRDVDALRHEVVRAERKVALANYGASSTSSARIR